MSTSSISQNQIEEKWIAVDAKGLRIGRAASKIAELLLGKDNPKIKAYHDPMVKVIVLNAKEIDYTRKRGYTKFYKRYSGYPSGLKVEDLDSLIERKPIEPLKKAIKGMLPKNKRGNKIFSQNLFVYEGSEHPHEAQKPEKVELTKVKL